MRATYIDHMGTDLSVVNAARVSFGKKSALEPVFRYFENFDISHGYETIREKVGEKLSEKDAKLISYLAKHDHWTPFAHTAITVHVKAPLFVARQLGKHQIGFVWNEISRRYVTDTPEFYTPDYWRQSAENVKQGSSNAEVNPEYNPAYLNPKILYSYREALGMGVCPEQARMVLPQSMYTEWYWTGNLYGYARMYLKRTAPDTQRETQEVARQIGAIIQPLFPVSWKSLVGEGK